MLADYVTMDQGTGAVHTAPAHGADDFLYRRQVQARSDLQRGRRRASCATACRNTTARQVFKANAPIVELLKARGVLHAYGEDRALLSALLALPQSRSFFAPPSSGSSPWKRPWTDGTLRSATLDEIKKVKWDPAWGEERISNMIATRPDWCISRQRIWGVPIAVFLCEACGKPLNDPAVNQQVVELFEREGADAWYTRSGGALLPAGTKCRALRRHEISQGDGHPRCVV